MNVDAADVPPPGGGFVTVTLAVPALAMSDALIVAVSLVALANVVVRGEPFQFTTEEETKLVPLTVSVKLAPPCVALDGESFVIVGAGLLMVKVFAEDVPPPGAGLLTVTKAVPAVLMSDMGTVAVRVVLLTKVVVRLAPFH